MYSSVRRSPRTLLCPRVRSIKYDAGNERIAMAARFGIYYGRPDERPVSRRVHIPLHRALVVSHDEETSPQLHGHNPVWRVSSAP